MFVSSTDSTRASSVQIANTIVALSTPPGRGGIGIVRLSGAGSLAIAGALTRDPFLRLEPNFVSLRNIYNPETETFLDQALITFFKEPHSFTGEDVVEISCHGSPVLLGKVIDAVLSQGARAASPGEFTLRAVANNRINLSQAEAIRDLIDAETESAARQAALQMRGELSRKLQPVKDQLVEIIVPLESALEFVEDDLPELAVLATTKKIEDLCKKLDELSDGYRFGRLLRDGLKVVLVGRPNVGKSSIFNRLLSIERAIVTPIAGTTRDSLIEKIAIDGVPVQLTDTAGLRASDDLVEVIGVERTREGIAGADLVVAVFDASAEFSSEDEGVMSELIDVANLVVLNKTDLMEEDSRERSGWKKRVQNAIFISAKTGEGFEQLRAAIMAPFASGNESGESVIITNSRHYDLFKRASSSLQSSLMHLKGGASEELTLVGLYDALRFIGQITGETTSEEILSQIFLTFCIGK